MRGFSSASAHGGAGRDGERRAQVPHKRPGRGQGPGAKRPCAPVSRSRQLHSLRGTSQTGAACRYRPHKVCGRGAESSTGRSRRHSVACVGRGARGTEGGAEPGARCFRSRSDTAWGMTCWRWLRDGNDARVSDQLHQVPLARSGPTEAAWFGSVEVLSLGHEVPVPRRVAGAATRDRAAGYCTRAGRGPYPERGPCSTWPAMGRPRALGQPRQSLPCTARVTRCRTRLICQRHRGSTRPGPRPRPAFRMLGPQRLSVGPPLPG
jgi:hypothetical protein